MHMHFENPEQEKKGISSLFERISFTLIPISLSLRSDRGKTLTWLSGTGITVFIHKGQIDRFFNHVFIQSL